MENIEQNNLNNQVPVNPAPVSREIPQDTRVVRFTKPQIIIALVCLVLILITVVFLIFKKSSSSEIQLIKPSPVATQSASLLPQVISEFAKTEAFVNFENKLQNLLTENETVDLTESKLTFPLLDMEITFK